jgi:hypothetical protein
LLEPNEFSFVSVPRIMHTRGQITYTYTYAWGIGSPSWCQSFFALLILFSNV